MEARVSARRQTVVALFIAAGLVAISCTDHESPTSPGSSSAASRATISGILLAASDSSTGRGGVAAGEPLVGATVWISSTGQTAQTDAAGRFTLADVAPGIVNLEIRGSGITSTATVAAAPGVVTRVTVTVHRGRNTVKIGPRSDGNEGTVNSISGKTFVLKNQRGTFTIQTDGNTQFRMRGALVSFGDLKVGQKVEVEGPPQPDGSILASRVKIENPEDEEEDVTRTPTPTVTGSPPTATSTRTPRPDDDDDRTKTPTVTGTPPTATPTRTPRPEDEGADLEGTVGSITGSSFVLMTKSGPVTIQTNGATRFRNDDRTGSFADIKAGEEVEVQGQVQQDKSVLASRVDIKGD